MHYGKHGLRHHILLSFLLILHTVVPPVFRVYYKTQFQLLGVLQSQQHRLPPARQLFPSNELFDFCFRVSELYFAISVGYRSYCSAMAGGYRAKVVLFHTNPRYVAQAVL